MGIGVEYVLMQMIAVRGGYHVADSHGYDYGTIGAGLRFMHLELDFSYLFAAKKCPWRQHLPGGSWTLLLIRTFDGPNIPDRTGIQTRFDEKECIEKCTLFPFSAISSYLFSNSSSSVRQPSSSISSTSSNPSCPS